MAKSAPHYSIMKIIDKIKNVTKVIFWLIFILSIAPSVLKKLQINSCYDDFINTLNIISISVFFVFEIVVEYILLPQSDSRRRDDFIDNSFGTKYSSESSDKYFDNDDLNIGLYKAATNLFENVFFTYSIIKRMTFRKTFIPSIVLISILLFAYYGFKEYYIGLYLLQALFSVTLLGGLIKHFILMVQLHNIYEKWIAIFQIDDFKTNTEKHKTLVYRTWLQYETLHSRLPADIPNNFFLSLNDQLTEEWKKIRLRYNIN